MLLLLLLLPQGSMHPFYPSSLWGTAACDLCFTLLGLKLQTVVLDPAYHTLVLWKMPFGASFDCCVCCCAHDMAALILCGKVMCVWRPCLCTEALHTAGVPHLLVLHVFHADCMHLWLAAVRFARSCLCCGPPCWPRHLSWCCPASYMHPLHKRSATAGLVACCLRSLG